jgi:hypothetical protein
MYREGLFHSSAWRFFANPLQISWLETTRSFSQSAKGIHLPLKSHGKI